jgi:hypothetical protein
MKRFLWLGCVLLVYVICSGCGDTFRPIIIPNPPSFPNPQAAHTVVSINDNAPASGPETVFGTAMVIDVSGDTDQSIANVGLAPVHAVQQSASVVLVVNHSVTGAQRDSLTRLNFSNTSIGSTGTISMPPNSAPNFVATTETSQAYVSLPNYLNPNTNTVVPSVAVINTNSGSIVTTIPLGTGANPMAIAETPDAKKLYVANEGLGTVSGFNTVDQSTRVICVNTVCPVPPATTLPLSSPPIWLAARSDSQAAYVLETSGTLAWINTSTTAGPDTLAETAINVPGANIMTYDPNLLRLYIPGEQEVAIVDISQSPPAYLARGPLPITAVSPTLRSAGDPCFATTAQTLSVVAVAALPDGSRAYVGAYYTDANDNICPQVTVINATNNTIETPSIPIPGFPDATNPSSQYYVPACATTRFRFMMAAGGDSTRVYFSSCDGGLVDIINTSTDAYLVNITAPIGIRPLIPPASQNPPMNPVFLIAGP